ncbi:MAG: transcriptional regulator of arginine metabolism [Halanaerobiales bacterium]|nr:transcriptional regulator of arginine metabolism [Halanaerobiales bacterium]
MKSKRHLKIINIIKDEDISTQEELVARLHEAGIDVTQATISRDIKRLGLIKVPNGRGGYKYSLPNERSQGDVYNWLRRMFQDFVVDMDYSENIILLKTLPGTAMGLGSAIDNAEWDGVIGSVAGDDTLLLVTKPKERTEEIFHKMEKLLL